jgi:single-strand DNA-binding protein
VQRTMVTVVGYLTDDPEIHHPTTGVTTAEITVACPRATATGETSTGPTEVIYLPCAIRRADAETAAADLKRGTRVIVTGHLSERICSTPTGQRRSMLELEVDDIGICLTADTGTLAPLVSVAQ